MILPVQITQQVVESSVLSAQFGHYFSRQKYFMWSNKMTPIPPIQRNFVIKHHI